MQITLLLNRSAGTLRGLDPPQVAEELADIFRARGHNVTTEIHAGRAAAAAIGRLCRERKCEALVVGGGDGTVSAAAAAAARSGTALGILPLGTMNLFARALGVPLEMHAAAQALAAGTAAKVDIGEVNGRFFVLHVSLGLHPRMIRMRERFHYGSRLGKIAASAQALWSVIRQPPGLHARLKIDGTGIERRTAAILISNNLLGEGHLPYADDLRQGKLGLYVATSGRWQDLLQLAAQVTFGDFARSPLLESWKAENLEIRLSRDVVNAAVDGEIVSLDVPLRLTIRERGLTVIRPAPAD